MMHKFKSMFKNRRSLYLIFFVVCIVTFTLTIAYAALSTTLNITGNTEVVAANWDVHFDNIICFDDTNSPKITSPTTITFNPVLNEPGDKYFFTVDVVNAGTIDAIIDSVTKLPELTSEQAKYIKYEISYANGETISTSQVVNSGSFVRLKVTVEYRSDITVADLPTSQTVLDLSIKLNYVQKDEDGIKIDNHGISDFTIVNVTDDIVGSEICLGSECFYTLGIDEETDEYTDYILFAKYNLDIGNQVSGLKNDLPVISPIINPTGLQDSRALGFDYIVNGDVYEHNFPWYGTIAFSDSVYWDENSDWSGMLFGDNNVVDPVYNYVIYLMEQGYEIHGFGLMYLDILEMLGCSSMDSCPYPWIFSTTYWTMSPGVGNQVYGVSKIAGVADDEHSLDYIYGIRPVVVYRHYK